MKILLAPSETKKEGGKGEFSLNSLSFYKLNPTREKLINEYEKIISSNNLEKKAKLLGLKKEKDINKYQTLKNSPTLKAIQRYTGVAFDYLDFESLDNKAKNFVENNVIIFSNLFGFILAKDEIPLYKVKQGESLNSLKPEVEYKKISFILDEYLENEDILDLRAGFYNKFYIPSKKYTTLKFLKNGKVVSHFAKAYRGLVLREIAKNNITSISQFLNLNIETLKLKEIIESKNKNELIFEINL